MGELTLRGVGAAPGVVAGQAVVLGTFVPGELVAPERQPAEIRRAHEAIDSEIAVLKEIAERLRAMGSGDDAEIVETGTLMAKDPTLLDRIEQMIRAGQSAPAAIAGATDEFAQVLAAVQETTLAERAADVRSLGRRAAARAAGAKLATGGVLIATDLGPADIADLGLAAGGAALVDGGVTAHAAIVSRSLGIPMVVGLGHDVLDVKPGEIVVLDADRGVVVRRPTRSRINAANRDGARRRHARDVARARRDEPALTIDGHRVTVLVNVATMAEAIEGLEQGAEGVGLLRTELPFLDAAAWPSARQQIEFLKPILARFGERSVTVRLFDFGGDKTPPFLRDTPKRGIDLLLGSPDALRCQLAAIVEAGERANVRILVPMVTRSDQMLAIRGMLASLVRDSTRHVQLGAMIETPEAAMTAGAIAEVSDFFSIGTNDLTQSVLGLDREHSKTAPVTDIRVWRLVDAAVRAGHAAGIAVDVCGEAASDPVAMPVLVGLGVDELSVAAARVGLVRERIRELGFASCRESSEKLLHQA